MLGLLFLLSVFYIGVVVIKYFFGKIDKGIFTAGAFITGSLISVSIIAILLILLHSLAVSLVFYLVVFILIFSFTFKSLKKFVFNKLIIKDIIPLVLLTVVLYLIFSRSFSLDTANNIFLIHTNLYQDFAAHIPIIKYFAGGGYMVEVPFYAGKGLIYHFMFDFYASILNFLGTRIDVSYNLLGAISFASLLSLLYQFSKKLFNNALVGILAVLFFVFNSNLSLINYISYYLTSPNIISSLYNNNIYLNGQIMGLVIDNTFLSINVFLNQRHLLFSIAALILILYLILFSEEKRIKLRKLLCCSLLIGLMPFWNVQVVVALYIILFVLAVVFKDKRITIIKIVLFSLILTVPQFLLIKFNSYNQITLRPGFLVWENLSLFKFILFWIWNLGFAIPLIILGLIKSTVFQRKIFLSFLAVFIVANIFQFSLSMFDNHKFFNVWIISINMFTAAGAVFLIKKHFIIKFVGTVLILATVASGIFNLLVVKNDIYAKIPDKTNSSFGKFLNTIPSENIIFTNGEIYDPASLMGRRIFLGRAQYIYLYGGDPKLRISQKEVVLSGKDKSKISKILNDNNVSNVIIYKDSSIPNLQKANINFFNKSFKKIYEDNFGIIYEI